MSVAIPSQIVLSDLVIVTVIIVRNRYWVVQCKTVNSLQCKLLRKKDEKGETSHVLSWLKEHVPQ